MDATPADVVRQLLVDLGVCPDSATARWSAFSGHEPDGTTTHDDCVTVYGTEGVDTGRLMPTGEATGYYGIQFRVRSRNEAAGWKKAAEIRTAIAETAYSDSVTVPAEQGTAEYRFLVRNFNGIGRVLRLGVVATAGQRYVHTLNCNAVLAQTN